MTVVDVLLIVEACFGSGGTVDEEVHPKPTQERLDDAETA